MSLVSDKSLFAYDLFAPQCVRYPLDQSENDTHYFESTEWKRMHDEFFYIHRACEPIHPECKLSNGVEFQEFAMLLLRKQALDRRKCELRKRTKNDEDRITSKRRRTIYYGRK